MKEQSEHQLRIEEFMQRAAQIVPLKPKMPSYEIRKLRAKLILEEALETIKSLGIDLYYNHWQSDPYLFSNNFESKFNFEDFKFPLNLSDITDGCCDLSVVTIGTLSACGIKDLRPLELVDQNNLDKFKGGFSLKEGKLIKPLGHLPPNFKDEIERQNKL